MCVLCQAEPKTAGASAAQRAGRRLPRSENFLLATSTSSFFSEGCLSCNSTFPWALLLALANSFSSSPAGVAAGSRLPLRGTAYRGSLGPSLLGMGCQGSASSGNPGFFTGPPLSPTTEALLLSDSRHSRDIPLLPLPSATGCQACGFRMLLTVAESALSIPEGNLSSVVPISSSAVAAAGAGGFARSSPAYMAGTAEATVDTDVFTAGENGMSLPLCTCQLERSSQTDTGEGQIANKRLLWHAGLRPLFPSR